jgi:hypothetical protein
VRRLLFAILLGGCFSEPSYEGRFCEESAPCPSGFRCVDGMCTNRPPLPLDSGVTEEADASSGEDAAAPGDAGLADAERADAESADAESADAGDPNLERCDDPIAHPSSGWEARHFTLGADFRFEACFGVEDVPGDAIDRDYRGTGPFNGTIVDFGSRYAATRTFQAGVHTFTFTHDDGLRVLIDGKVVYELWAHGYVAGARAYSTYLTAGEHQIDIEHFDDEGWAQIVVSWERGCRDLATPVDAWLLSYHGYDAATGAVIQEHCYGFETMPSGALSISGPPAPVVAGGVSAGYAIAGRGIYDFDGMTLFDFQYEDGMRADIYGLRVIDDWTPGAPIAVSTEEYLPGLAEISFEKFATTDTDSLSITWRSACSQSPPFGPTEWWARYYRVLYTANPDSWALDRGDCLGAQIISSDRLMQSGEPAPIAALGILALWGAEYFGTRTFGQNTSVGITYDDGLRVFDGNTLWYEDWTAPQIGMTSLSFGAGTHAFRLEYFQNNGGTQLQFTW